jgi:hypothetical protein
MSESRYRWVSLPHDFATTVTDCTVAEAMAFRRMSRCTVYEKIRDGSFRTFKDGRITKILVASLVEDRERQLNAPLTAKRPVGRPRKQPDAPPPAPEAASPPRRRKPRPLRPPGYPSVLTQRGIFESEFWLQRLGSRASHSSSRSRSPMSSNSVERLSISLMID